MLGGMSQNRSPQPPKNKFAAPTAVSTAHDKSPHKTILTGESNVGKTHYVSTVDHMFIMPVEQGLKGMSPHHHPGHYDVFPDTYDELIQGLRYFRDVLNAPVPPPEGSPPEAKARRPYKHFAVDSIAGMERLINLAACGKEGVEHMEAKAYRAVWSAAQPLHEQVQVELDRIRGTGVNIWLTALSCEAYEAAQTGRDAGETYKVKDLAFRGSGKPLDELRILWRGWADNVFYLMKDVRISKGTKNKRTVATAAGRILITEDTGLIKAKHRGMLPAQIPATWEDLRSHWIAAIPAKPEKLRAQLDAVLAEISEENRALILPGLSEAGADAVKLAAVLSRAQGMAAIERSERDDPEEEADEDEKGKTTPADSPTEGATATA